MKVLVTHPGRQHSHQAALALEAAGLLAGYWAGVPAVARQGRFLPAPLWRRLVRYAPVDLPAARLRWAPWVPALRRLGDRLPGGLAARADFLACRLFDRWAAARLARLARSGGRGSGAPGREGSGRTAGPDLPRETRLPGAPRVVIACEISARDTFRVARRLGIATVLDAAATHHRTQDRLHGFAEPEPVHRRITAVKDEEIALADLVLTVSELARQSYLEAGVPPERVRCLPLGADVALFAAEGEAAGKPGERDGGEAAGDAATFVFAGAASRVKGFDLLLAAFARVRTEEPGVRLWAIGPPGDAGGAARARADSSRSFSLSGETGSGTGSGMAAVPADVSTNAGSAADWAGVEALGRLPQAELARRLRAADCLVLPSRNESFGMVVPEALAAGLPVVVSDRVGAATLVREGVNGWVVPAGDAAALARRLLWCARHRQELRRMRPACRESAAAADWSVYRERLPALLREALGWPGEVAAGGPSSSARAVAVAR